MSKWTDFVKAFAAKRNLSYGCALSNPDCSIEYRAKYGLAKKVTAKKEQEQMASEDFDAPAKKEKVKKAKPKVKLVIEEDEPPVKKTKPKVKLVIEEDEGPPPEPKRITLAYQKKFNEYVNKLKKPLIEAQDDLYDDDKLQNLILNLRNRSVYGDERRKEFNYLITRAKPYNEEKDIWYIRGVPTKISPSFKRYRELEDKIDNLPSKYTIYDKNKMSESMKEDLRLQTI